MSDAVYVDAVAPATCVMVVTDAESDLSTVSAAVFQVLKPGRGGIEETWSVTMDYDATAQALTLSHAFELGDVDVEGRYAMFAELTTPEGTFRTQTRTFRTIGKFDITF